MTTLDRDALGKIVREAWVRWAKTQPSPKPSWLVPYEELSEPDQEADRQIGEAVLEAVLEDVNVRRICLAEKKSRSGLTRLEAAEFAWLQELYFDALEARDPRKAVDLEGLDALERRLGSANPEATSKGGQAG